MSPLQRGVTLARFLMHQEDWTLGVVRQTAADIALNGLRMPIEWLPAPSGAILADPGCLVLPDGTRRLFAEYLVHGQERGEIWTATIPPGADPAQARLAPLLRMPNHMSYPFPFIADDGSAWMTAETWEAGEARLWQFRDGTWADGGLLFAGRSVIDPTLWRAPDGWWLFCTLYGDKPNEHLHVFHAPRLGDTWTPHRLNPVVRDRRHARPAGPLFSADGALIRPAQDCSSTYGAAVNLRVIRRLSLDHYEEETVRRIEPPRGQYPHGLHTLCPGGDVTFVDGKRLRFDLAGLPTRLKARLSL